MAAVQQGKEAKGHIRELARRALSRTAGAPLIAGNKVRILRNASENFPAWLEAIAAAEQYIHFECYIIDDDRIGRQFVEALTEKARKGVRVRLMYDWLGSMRTSFRMYRPLLAAGGEVRIFNPPKLESPFGWLSRDHRKMIGVDGKVAYVTGLCLSEKWLGRPEKGLEEWRDTGVVVSGPAVADIEETFARVWDVIGEPLPQEERPQRDFSPEEGSIDMRIIGTEPNTTGLYRLDQFIASVASERLWLADAYFVGLSPYVQALRSAALDGVDVRLLVPGGSDIQVLRPVSTAGYRSLLEAGVRVFEWNGPMMHAKTAVADGRWSRVGSSNLNIASWLGNYELDVSIEDEQFGRDMEDMYLKDLDHSTEIVLMAHNRVQVAKSPHSTAQPSGSRKRKGSAVRVAASALRITNTVGAALSNRRVLGRAEGKVMAGASVLLLALVALAVIHPPILAYPFAVLGFWIAVSMLAKAWRLRK